MFKARRIESLPTWTDRDGIKIYTISAQNKTVDHAPFMTRLLYVKKQKPVAWPSVPAFVIFHDGVSVPYLVLAWWGNDNELFLSVSVKTKSGWVEDSTRFSFCLWDLEVMWHERNFFIDFVYCSEPDIAGYRTKRFSNDFKETDGHSDGA